MNLTKPRDGRAVSGGTGLDWSRARATNRDAAAQKFIAEQCMLCEGTGATFVQALSDPHAAADQPGYVNKAAYNQYGVWYELRRQNAV